MIGWLQEVLGRELSAPDSAAVGIAGKPIPEAPPKFKREYTKRLTDKATCTITMRNSYIGSGRISSGELTQPNGRWVLFDPERIADKILDPALVPLVEEFAKQVMAVDRAFMKGQPSEFVDEGGTVWRWAA